MFPIKAGFSNDRLATMLNTRTWAFDSICSIATVRPLITHDSLSLVKVHA
jgi:hypothetical protein